MKISEVAKLSGVTVRTLHYYDEIGLLKPSKTTEAGYRMYSIEDLEKLQQILFFRELDFPLNEIKEIMVNPKYDKIEALNKHKELLIEKRKRIDGLVTLIDKTIKGDNNMSFKEFDNSKIEENKRKYSEEVKKRWGNTDAYKEYEKKTTSYDKNSWNTINEEMAKILKEFADNRDKDVNSDIVQSLVEKWRGYITLNFYNCTKEILSCLGLMYIGDERFKENIDKYGEGTSEFMAKAIEIYCSK
ncbi:MULTISPECIES: MerR family transcriptional regulator [unclassified Clostridium]|uniref:MerR family transcriptional regulator n=1 Tax=unclassified Clostridium TaxID=2614128 RepID=UPI001897AA1A|nr:MULTISPECIES: MerR family transcriptional regulator [unclassified Clostridium]MBP3915833.1 MerR family transcriptional regulator [Clostridium sp.]MEE0932201.1 MerR family transcriptional regulator [Clostridium sp.]